MLVDNLPSGFGLMVPSKRKVKTDYGQDDGFTAGELNHKKPRYNLDIANSKSAKSKLNASQKGNGSYGHFYVVRTFLCQKLT